MNSNSYFEDTTAMQVSERGQVTIPLHIREQFGLLPHTEIEFVVERDRVTLRKKASSVRQQVASLYGRRRFGQGTDALMKLLRDDD